MLSDIYDVIVELTQDMLGTVPHNRDVFSQHVARTALGRAESVGTLASGTPATQGAINSALLEEEGCVEQLEEKGWTGFMKDEQGFFLFDYMISGNIRAAAEVIGEKTGGDSEIKQLKYKFRKCVFVKPRRIYPPQEFFEGELERPLRGDTAQGPRVTVVRSDVLRAGARFAFELHVVAGKLSKGIDQKLIEELLSYGEYMGFGQWRTGGYGTYRVISLVKRK